jgi:hypothetical protein
MSDVFWIGAGFFAFGLLMGVFGGARSRTATVRDGAMVGAAIGLMASFPLLAIGISAG